MSPHVADFRQSRTISGDHGGDNGEEVSQGSGYCRKREDSSNHINSGLDTLEP